VCYNLNIERQQQTSGIKIMRRLKDTKITKELVQSIINELPVTNTLAIMEQYVRMDYKVENGVEMYASFASINGTLIRLTVYETFEEAWLTYNEIFSIESRVLQPVADIAVRKYNNENRLRSVQSFAARHAAKA
jgi:hypothetical protein